MALKGSCHTCGKCCEAIHISISPEEIAKGAENQREWSSSDFVFIADNWTPITREEADSINPHFAEMEKRGADYGHMHFYTCKNHDKETKLCKIYDKRPHVCSGYPWYGAEPRAEEAFYTMDCGYRIDSEATWLYNK